MRSSQQGATSFSSSWLPRPSWAGLELDFLDDFGERLGESLSLLSVPRILSPTNLDTDSPNLLTREDAGEDVLGEEVDPKEEEDEWRGE